MRPISLLAVIAVMTAMPAKAENNSFDIDLKKTGAPIQSTMGGKPVAGQDGQNGLFASAVRDDNWIYIKVANTSEQAQEITLNFTGLKKNATVEALKRVDLSSDKLYEDNSIEAPTNIVPVENSFDGEGQTIQTVIKPLSFSVFILTIE